MTDATLPLPEPGERLPADGMDAGEAVLAAAATAVDAVAGNAAMDPLDRPHRLLLVHAHPDDETIGTGAVMAQQVVEGTLVTLVTCTLGEEGEVVVPELAQLASTEEDGLGQHRIGELAAAMEALGVTDSRFLGGPGRWRDSGMMGTPQNDRLDCFWQADVDEAVADLVRIVRELRPQVVITYDDRGGYGHPDHIQAHRVTVAAVDRAADPAYLPALGETWQIQKLYWTALPKSVLQAGIDLLKASGDSNFFGVDSADDLPFGNPDDEVTTEIDARDQLAGKVAAMRAHRSQIAVDGPFFALSNGIGQQAMGTEYFVLARGQLGPVGPSGRESDLFAGVDK